MSGSTNSLPLPPDIFTRWSDRFQPLQWYTTSHTDHDTKTMRRGETRGGDAAEVVRGHDPRMTEPDLVRGRRGRGGGTGVGMVRGGERGKKTGRGNGDIVAIHQIMIPTTAQSIRPLKTEITITLRGALALTSTASTADRRNHRLPQVTSIVPSPLPAIVTRREKRVCSAVPVDLPLPRREKRRRRRRRRDWGVLALDRRAQRVRRMKKINHCDRPSGNHDTEIRTRGRDFTGPLVAFLSHLLVPLAHRLGQSPILM